jgi:hypothetical protein
MICKTKNKLTMKKTVIILSIIALLAGSCVNKKTGKTPFDLTTFPSEWRSLTTENGELAANDSPFTVLRINENKLTLHYCVRVDETGYDQSDFEYEIADSYQAGDTIIFSLNVESDYAIAYKFIWLDKNKGLGEWIFDDERGIEEIYVVNERVSEYETNNNENTSSSVKKWGEQYSFEGTYRNNYLYGDYGDSCNVILHIKKTGDGYSFVLLNEGSKFRGKVSILEGGIRLEGIPWVSYLGALDDDGNPVEKDLEPMYGIDAMVWEEDGNLVLAIQNSGNSMNSYQKLNCEDRMIALEKEKK